VDARSDIWAVGVILHELITGTGPFGGDSLPEIIAAILTVPPLSMRLRRPDAPAELEAVVLRCLEKEPDARFPNVGELAVALAPFGPARSRMSMDRVVRVIAGRKETSISPGVDIVTRAVLPALQTPRTDPSWQTSGVLRSARSGRRIAVAAVAGVIVASAVTAGVVLTRSPARAPPLVPAVAETAKTATAEPTASTPPVAPATPAVVAPSATAAVAVSPLGQRPATTRPTAAATSTLPAPVSTKPGPADFGGRK
jgi:serine/threonine-protein kinase